MYTCIYVSVYIYHIRRTVWNTDRADVNNIRWMFEEDEARVDRQGEAEGNFVYYSKRLSIFIESHHLIYVEKAKRGRAQFVITVESSRKIFHLYTGFQYEIDFERQIQKNVMTGYERRLQRKDLRANTGAGGGGASIGTVGGGGCNSGNTAISLNSGLQCTDLQAHTGAGGGGASGGTVGGSGRHSRNTAISHNSGCCVIL